MQLRTRSLLAIACLLVPLGIARAEVRLALVIGNGDYQFSPLRNPKNDAGLMAQTLESLGFEVALHLDADQRTMKRAVRDFGNALNANGSQSIGLFYYAGHGVQVAGKNYLIPIGAKIETEGDVDIESVSASSVLSSMELSGARLSLVILDACRNNPFRGFSRSTGTGLARVNAPAGSLVAYATSPGTVALDGKGRNSPYTFALAREMKVPGRSVEQMFRHVRNRVIERTNERQIPWESSSLTGNDFFFSTPITPINASALTKEIDVWKQAEAMGDDVAYQEYLSAYPDGVFASVAKQILSETVNLEPAQTKQTATSKSTPVEAKNENKQLTPDEENVLASYAGKYDPDGQWKLTYRVNFDGKNSSFCRTGETFEEEFEVSNGSIDVWVTSSRGATARLTGSITGYGAFVAKINNSGRSPDIEMRTNVSVGTGFGQSISRSCTGYFEVERLTKFNS